MSHTATWKRFGEAILSHPDRTLAAYLGQLDAQRALQAESIAFPTLDDFRADRQFDPNPFLLDLPADVFETKLFVHSLAVWGPDVLISSSYSCGLLQVERHTSCRSDLVTCRDAALDSVAALIQSATSGHYEDVRQAASRCDTLYAAHEEEPDSPEAQTVWSHLGAPWFAAKSAAQDYQLDEYDGPGPREGSPTWCKRNTVWAICAAETAADWSSHEEVRRMICRSLLDGITGRKT